MKRNRKAGLTLIELLTAAAILGLISSLAYKSVTEAMKTWRAGENELLVWQSGVRMMSKTSKDLRCLPADANAYMPEVIAPDIKNSKVIKFNARYWSRTTGWVDSWDKSSDKIPQAIEITIHLEGNTQLTSVVHIPAGRNL